jgi:phasin family protein
VANQTKDGLDASVAEAALPAIAAPITARPPIAQQLHTDSAPAPRQARRSPRRAAEDTPAAIVDRATRAEPVVTAAPRAVATVMPERPGPAPRAPEAGLLDAAPPAPLPPMDPAVMTTASRVLAPVAAASDVVVTGTFPAVAANADAATASAAPDVTPSLPPRRARRPVTAPANQESVMTTTEEFLSHGQANVEAVVKSGQIWATGLQDLTRTLAESAQAQFDHTVATWKALAGTKSLREAFDIQSTHGRAALEKAVADTGRLTDASLKLAEQSFAPISARLSIATEKFVRPH